MLHINRIALVTATASLAAGAVATPASATHIAGHTVQALEQDIQALSQAAQNQAESAREVAETAGSNTRRHVQRAASDRVGSTSRTARQLRSGAESRAAAARSRVQSHAEDAMADAGRRVGAARSSARQRASTAVSSARSSLTSARSDARRRAADTKAKAGRLLALVQRAVAPLAAELGASLRGVLQSGSVSVASGGSEYSAGWTYSNGCWNGRMNTPLNPPGSETRRRIGTSVQATPRRGAEAQTSRGDVAASTGC